MRVISFFLGYWQGKDPGKSKQAKLWLASIILASIFTGATNTALLALINTALNHDDHKISRLIIGFVGLCLVMPIARFVTEILFNSLILRTLSNLYISFYHQVLSAPLPFLEKFGAHRLTAIVSDDVKTISDAFLAFIRLCMYATILIGCLFYLGWLSWQVLVVTLVFLILGIGSYQLMARRATGYLNLARNEYDTLFNHFRALTEGNKELKLNRKRRQAFFKKLFQPTVATFTHYTFIGNVIWDIARGWGEVLYFILIGVLIFVILPMQDVDAETQTGYTLVILYMMTPVQGVVGRLTTLGRANVVLKRVEQLGLSLADYVTEKDVASEPLSQPTWQNIQLLGVTYTYQQREETPFKFGPIDLNFTPGEVVFLTGGNGSGKTTLAKILVGLYPPDEGEIRLDNQPITAENRDDYRQHFSTVFLDFFLFEHLLGIETPELDTKAHDYLDKLQLSNKVEVDNGKLSTINLSQGQRKRLALLTAYLENRPFYVFDEWATNQDPLFREIFYTQILADLKKRGKAVLVISHDDRYFHLADRIIKLDYGTIDPSTHTKVKK